MSTEAGLHHRAESFFVDASRYGLVADGETDNTGRLQAALSTCPRGGTVYVPAGRYRTASLFMKSCTTLYLEKGAVLLGDNDRTHLPHPARRHPQRERSGRILPHRLGGQPAEQLCGPAEHHPGA